MCTQEIPNSQDYDLIIIGGGATGLALALGLIPHLHKQQLNKILLLEKETSSTVIPGRSIALNQNTLNYFHSLKLPKQLIQQLGLSHTTSVGELLAPIFCPIQQITTKTDSHKQTLELYAQNFRVNSFGGVVDLAQLQAGLESILAHYQTLYRTQGQTLPIELCKGITVTSCSQDDSSSKQIITMLTQDGTTKTLSCNLAVVANGAKFITGLENTLTKSQVLNINQYGIIADVIFNQPVHNHAIEFFTNHGPVAFLPTSSQSACVVWCGTKEQVEHLKINQQTFANELNNNLLQIQNAQEQELDLIHYSVQAYNQGLQALNQLPQFIKGANEFTSVIAKSNQTLQVVGITNSTTYPLPAMRLTQISQQQVIFLGNAAHTLHPVSGQGFNLAILGVENLLQAINQALEYKDHSHKFWQNIASNYELLHLPVIDQVYSRTTKLATTFIPHGSNPVAIRFMQDFALSMLQGTPWLQELIVQPSQGKTHSPWLNFLIKCF